MTETIDREHVIALLKNFGSVAEVARMMNIHENTVRAIVRKARKLCVRCGVPIASTVSTSCKKCQEFDRDRMKKLRKQRRREGVCVECGGPRLEGSRSYCRKHQRASVKRNDKYRAKRKGVQSPRQKKEDLLERYGADAWKRWQHAEAKCEACGAAYGEITIHVHHVDEDRTNNTFENFACLCFDCHRAVHRLISSRDRKALISWFEKTYPQHRLR